jgi:DNA-binding MarR family transcriptional regulator
MQGPAVTIEQLTDEILRFLAGTMRMAQDEFFRIVADLDLTLTQFKMLHMVGHSDEELTPSQLAKSVGLSPAATGRAVDALIRHDLVARRDDDEDRRVKRLSLTDAGRQVLERLTDARREGMSRIVAELTPQQRDDLSAALQPLLTPLSPDCAQRKEDVA